jgi:crotonobetainyl-CoA:carnitine CoA-transferase CaiB-like acyl-CoA transferase
VLDAAFRKESTGHWLKALSGVLPVAPVLDVAQALRNPHVRAVGMIDTIEHPLRPGFQVLANPLRFDSVRPDRAPGSALGADNAALLGAGGPAAKPRKVAP